MGRNLCQSPTHADSLFNEIPKASVERDDVRVGRPNLEIHLRASEGCQPTFCATNQGGGNAAATPGGQHCQVVDPTADAIKSCNDRTNEFPIGRSNEQEFRLNPQLVLDHQCRGVPRRIVWKDAGPKTFQFRVVRSTKWSNDHLYVTTALVGHDLWLTSGGCVAGHTCGPAVTNYMVAGPLQP